jgi:hypothetical protein
MTAIAFLAGLEKPKFWQGITIFKGNSESELLPEYRAFCGVQY